MLGNGLCTLGHFPMLSLVHTGMFVDANAVDSVRNMFKPSNVTGKGENREHSLAANRKL